MKRNRWPGEDRVVLKGDTIFHQKEKYNSSFLNGINDNFILLDHDDNFFYINKKAQLYFAKNNLIGKNIWQEYPLLVGSDFYNQLKKVKTEKKHVFLQSKSPYSEEWFAMTAYPFHAGTVIFFEDTTVHKESEENLRKIKKKYKNQFNILSSVVSMSQDPIIIFDHQGRFLFVNRAAENIISKKSKYIIGKTINEIESSSVDLTTIEKDLKKTLSLRLPIKGEVGESFEYILNPLSNKSSDKLVLCIIRDLTTHKQIEKKLMEAKNQLEAILQNSIDGISVFNPNGQLLYVNDAAVKFNGFSSKEEMLKIKDFHEILKNRLKKFKIKNKASRLVTIKDSPLYNSFNNQSSYEELVNFYDKKIGIRRQFLLKSQPVFDEQNNLQMLVNIHSDLTNQKIIEEELSVAKNQLEIILKNAGSGIVVFNSSGEILYFNDSIWKILGFKSNADMRKMKSIDDIYNTQFENGKLLKNELNEEFKLEDTSIKKAINGQKNNISVFQIFNKVENRYRWIKAKSKSVKDENGKIKMIINIIEDITEQKELEKRKDDFIGIVSHEVKTPLTSIKAFAQILLKDMEEKGDIKSQKYLTKMNSQIDRFLNLVLKLLDTTRIQEKSLILKKEDFNIGYLVKEIKSDLTENICNEINIEDDGSVVINADRQRINQVITNLISNAAKYSSKSEPINIRIKRGNENAVISVQDFGIGITKEEQKKIFDRFYQASNYQPNHDPSLGLGLYISSQIINMHSGHMWVQSQPAIGSTFYFTLPF